MSQRKNGAPQGPKDEMPPAKDQSMWLSVSMRRCRIEELTKYTAQDKQARLLSQEVGHFSLVRALHLADFITELNGTSARLNSYITSPSAPQCYELSIPVRAK